MGEFTVTVKKEVVVAAELPKQLHWLPLSNLDLCILPPEDYSIFLCYKKPTSGDNQTFGSMVEVLKKAMAQALVSYYALAGEVVSNSVGEPELLCNNRGVDFIEAYADIDLKDLNFYKPDETIQGKLVPKKKHGVLAVQATELKCGGLVMGYTFNHLIVDGYSAGMFLFSWGEIAQSRPLSLLPPSFRRSLLSPRRPPSMEPSFNDWYVPFSTLPSSEDPLPVADHYISRIYHIAAEQINQIQLLATTNSFKPTKLESFTAFLWKTIAKCATNNQKISKLGLAVDGRMRLSGGNKEKEMAMASYFGNVVSLPYREKKVDDLVNKPLSWVASEVHGFSQAITTKEHFLGLIDWVEANGPSVANLYCKGSKDGPAILVSSALQLLTIWKADFGWGRPVFGSAYYPTGGDVGYVMPIPSLSGKNNRDWLVYMYLSKEQIKRIENEAAHIFRPFTYYSKFSKL